MKGRIRDSPFAGDDAVRFNLQPFPARAREDVRSVDTCSGEVRRDPRPAVGVQKSTTDMIS